MVEEKGRIIGFLKYEASRTELSYQSPLTVDWIFHNIILVGRYYIPLEFYHLRDSSNAKPMPLNLWPINRRIGNHKILRIFLRRDHRNVTIVSGIHMQALTADTRRLNV